MIRASRRLIAGLSLGVSVFALPAAPAAWAQDEESLKDSPAYCGDDTDRRCGPLVDDSIVERRGVAPNLERGDAGHAEAFRLSVDGVPTAEGDMPNAADRQRATDLDLARSGINVQVTALEAVPMLSVVAAKPVVSRGESMAFFVNTNYASLIEKAELRLFEPGQNADATPQAVIPVRLGEPILWTADGDEERSLRYILRVYDAKGRFDETAVQTLRVTTAPVTTNKDVRTGPVFDNQRTTGNIAVNGATITVSGNAGSPDARVSVFGMNVPVDPAGGFVFQQIQPSGAHEIAIEVARPGEVPQLFRRAVDLPDRDQFLVAIVDITGGHRSFDPAKNAMQGDDADYRRDYVDGRLAFYYKGRISNRWRLTASADTGEQKLSDLFDQFDEKDPRSLLRRLDPERHYPIYGDDSTTVEDAPTYGRFYVRAESENAEAMWGNFQTQLNGTELIRYQRSLYGAKAAWQNAESTSFGERRTEITGFAADPGTIGSREEFASTGGSVYYFGNQDIAPGSERIFAEVRDRDSGLVIERKELIAARDYEVNYIQGRILLRNALPITADSNMFVHQSSLRGNPVWLVATYEYAPGLTRLDAFTVGGRAQHWLGDHVRIGASAYSQGEDQASQDLYGADITLRYKPGTYVKAEFARANGMGNSLFSSTGGYDFTNVATEANNADAMTVEFAADLADLGGDARGAVAGYWRHRDAGFSGPGELTFGEGLDQFGVQVDTKIAKNTTVKGKADFVDGNLTERHTAEIGLRHEVADGWFGALGVRSNKQEGQASAYSPMIATGDQTGARTDAAVSFGYRNAANVDEKDDEKSRPWSLAGFAQKTLERSGGRLENDRYGLQGDMAISDRLTLKGEVSEGDLGFGADAGANYSLGDRGSLYASYALAGENPDAFNTGRLGRLTAGTRYRFNTTTSVFAEGRYEHGTGPVGFTQAYGVDFTPFDGWTFGTRYETGKLEDALGADIKREVIGGNVDYGGERLRWSTALEYRMEDSSSLGKRKTWATRNLATWKATEALRLFAKGNFSISNADQSAALDADYYEMAVAAAYRSVKTDAFNLLAKYTYLYDLPSPAQVDGMGLNIDYAQRSHIVAVDGTYQITPRFALGAKVAHRVGELRASRDGTAPWFDSKATFWAIRGDYRIVKKWDLLVEMRQLSVSEADDSRLGALVGVYRHVGNNVKLGVGYNFTDYSDDLTDLSYDEKGFFFNIIGKF